MPDRSIRLAPLYDLVCTVYYPEPTDKMAMKIGGEAKSALIYPRQIERFAADAALITERCNDYRSRFSKK